MKTIHNSAYSYKSILKTIGPGILWAGAAIGASHLVMATRGGAKYGLVLIWLVVLINLVKYPFFEFSYRYTANTGQSMLEGYKNLGLWAIVTFFILSFLTSIINFAAVTIVTAGLTAYFFNLQMSSFTVSILLLAVIILVLFIGRYALLDKILKVMIIFLAIATAIAFFSALHRGSQEHTGFIPPEIWDAAGITFLIAFMGWMPTPIEASIWPSLWALERENETSYKPKFREALVDFHIGYVGSALLAIFFVGLGAYIMYGTGEEFSPSGVEFSKQLVALYTKIFGSWSKTIISAIVLFTMFSTALTVIDGYPRSLEGSITVIFPAYKKNKTKLYRLWAVFLAISSAVIIGLFSGSMKSLLFFATIISFLAAPVFAFINYKVVTSDFIPDKAKPKLWLKFLSWFGMIFLFGFSIIYIISNFVL